MNGGPAPSVTFWNRLEPSTHDSTLDLGLQVQVADPFWMLARQWQLGEYSGDDAGSPVQCTGIVERMPVTGVRFGPAGGPIAPLAQGAPLAAQLESEPVNLDLKGAVQIGLYFEAQLASAIAAAGAGIPTGALTAVIGWFRTNYPVDGTPAADAASDAAGDAYRQLVSGRVTHGLKVLADSNTVSTSWLGSHLPVPAAGPAAAAAASQTRSYYASLYVGVPPATSWDSVDLRYAFAVGEQSPNDALELDGSGFAGGDIDWYSFDLNTPAPASFPEASTVEAAFAAIPVHATFRGMPNARWWTFDDRDSDLGQLVADQTDLVKLLIMEYVNVCGNDWFQLPISLPSGSLSRVGCLLVTDTFGVATSIDSANPDTSNANAPWSMYTLSDGTVRSDLLLLPPSAGPIAESAPLEQVNFVRDDGALMVWGVERTVPGQLDQGVDAFESYVRTIGPSPSSTDPTPTGGADIAYVLEKRVPYNWIPFVPQQYAPLQGTGVYRRGAMVRFDPASKTWVPVPPIGVILQPDGPALSHPMILRPESVPRVGAEIGRFYRRARGPDGSTNLWIGRRIVPGKGPGNSGLSFDGIVPHPGAGSS